MRVVTTDGNVIVGIDREQGLFAQVWNDNEELIFQMQQFYPTCMTPFSYKEFTKHLTKEQLKEINKIRLNAEIFVLEGDLVKLSIKKLGQYFKIYSQYLHDWLDLTKPTIDFTFVSFGEPNVEFSSKDLKERL